MSLFNFTEEDRLIVFLCQYLQMGCDNPPVPILHRLAMLRGEGSRFNWRHPKLKELEGYMHEMQDTSKWGAIIRDTLTEEEAIWHMIVEQDVTLAVNLFNKFVDEVECRINVADRERGIPEELELAEDEVYIIKEDGVWTGYTKEGIQEFLSDYDMPEELYTHIMERYGNEVFETNEVHLATDHYVKQELLWMPTEYLHYYYYVTRDRRIIPTLKVSAWFSKYDLTKTIPAYVAEGVAEALQKYAKNNIAIKGAIFKDFINEVTRNRRLSIEVYPMGKLGDICEVNRMDLRDFIGMLDGFRSDDTYFAIYQTGTGRRITSFWDDERLPVDMVPYYWDYLKARGAGYFRDEIEFSEALYAHLIYLETGE